MESKLINVTEGTSEETKATCDFQTTTCFVEDGVMASNVITGGSSYDDITVSYQSIPDFLSKPLLVHSFLWSTADTIQTDKIAAQSVIADVLANSSWVNKLQGFNLIRGTAVYRIMLNANPYQQGKLYLNFMPCYTQVNAADVSQVAIHRATMCGIRQLPGVEIDCRDGVAEIEIPYITPTTFYDLKLGLYDWASYWITVLAPLQSSVMSDTVSVTVFLYFKDFELAAPLVPQMAGPGGKRKVRSTVGAEVSAVSSGGALSNALNVGSKIASSLSAIPALAPIAAPAAWISNAAAGVASFFGWSKPRSEQVTQPMCEQTMRYAAVSDGVDMSVPLALRGDNMLTISDDCNPCGSDQMSWAYLKKVPAFIPNGGNSPVNYHWNVSDAVGTTILSSFAITPSLLAQAGSRTISSHTTGYEQGGPVFYIGQMFALWRGSIDLTIKFAKTDSHSGRLLVTWTPLSTTGTAAPTTTTSVLSLRTIIDIRTSNEITINLPFLQGFNYLQNGTPSGYVDVIVLNELQAPSICSQEIDVLFYWAGGDDFEVAKPGGSIVQFSPQMGGSEIASVDAIGGYPMHDQGTAYAQRSIGELFTSVKQLLSRYSLVGMGSNPSTGTGWYIWPWATGMNNMIAGTGVQNAPRLGGDSYCFMINMYAFYKGGVRIVPVLPPTATPQQAMVSIVHADQNDTVFSTVTNFNRAFSWYTDGRFANYGYSLFEIGKGMWPIEMPWQATTQMSLVLNQTTSNQVPTETSQCNNTLYLSLSSTGICGTLLRSVRDDFQLIYFLGCPPVYLTYS